MVTVDGRQNVFSLAHGVKLVAAASAARSRQIETNASDRTTFATVDDMSEAWSKPRARPALA